MIACDVQSSAESASGFLHAKDLLDPGLVRSSLSQHINLTKPRRHRRPATMVWLERVGRPPLLVLA
jgi:hypothetical protein